MDHEHQMRAAEQLLLDRYGRYGVTNVSLDGYYGSDRFAVAFVVDTDAQRDVIVALPDYMLAVQRMIAEQFPDLAQHMMTLGVGSQETVDRDYGGDWHVYSA